MRSFVNLPFPLFIVTVTPTTVCDTRVQVEQTLLS